MLADRPDCREETNVQPSLDCQYQLRKDDLVWRGVDDETIILDLRTSLYLSLNSAAASLWQSLEKGATERQMAESLCDKFGIAEDRARLDVKAFIACCQERDLLDPTA
jgi:Coenzyme PQQ synthesis protein D (PqqD)